MYITPKHITMKQQHKEWITLAALVTALLSIGMFICWLASEICKPL